MVIREKGRWVGPLGTTARAVVGTCLVVAVLDFHGLRAWDVLGALTVMPAIAFLTALGVNAAVSGTDVKRRGRRTWSGAQVAAACLVIVVVIGLGTALTFVTPLNGGSLLLFFGVSMLLAAALGYDGCEVLALPNLVLRRRDAIWCPLYSPLDVDNRHQSVDEEAR